MASSVITSPTYDPKSYSEGLANEYVAGTKAILDGKLTKNTATTSALSTLSAALSAFQGTLSSLVNSTTSVQATSATFSNTAVATATATAKAVPGTYSFYVQQLATAGQVSYNVNDSVATNAGAMNVVLADGSTFQVDLANADNNMDGVLSAKEVAAAINSAANNGSRVTASTMTVNGQTKLLLTSAKTGADNAVASIDVSGLGDAGLQASLSSQSVVRAASNAIVRVGDANGEAVEQASNTFKIVDDVSFTVTQAQAVGAAPVTMTVGADTKGTAANVQSFVTAYNTLLAAFNTVTAAGDHTPTSSTDTSPTSADAGLHNDAGVLNLRERLNSALRAATGGVSLINFGITAGKDGTLSLKTELLERTVANNPGALDSLFGRAGIGVDSGVLGAMNKLTTAWTSSAGGYISARRDTAAREKADIDDRQASLQNQFDNAYKRYLAQFTALQQLQSSMTSTSNMFTALFSSDSSS
ncbi:flagellar filament capping protein FliD [Pseudoduganella sp. FT55W]|uniref:Flagellar hook-associated protein 2 n=1 Tax=Duganella rivi TaxID=2666083 RepID=A0A7X4KEX5_9BURK|nr:flagellar filament capping protein FliD [Duganella rivi]MYM70462.1 flagellar filament capping protein FliD [Duganella rivi]